VTCGPLVWCCGRSSATAASRMPHKAIKRWVRQCLTYVHAGACIHACSSLHTTRASHGSHHHQAQRWVGSRLASQRCSLYAETVAAPATAGVCFILAALVLSLRQSCAVSQTHVSIRLQLRTTPHRRIQRAEQLTQPATSVTRVLLCTCAGGSQRAVRWPPGTSRLLPQ
jgi:hypothetical protein